MVDIPHEDTDIQNTSGAGSSQMPAPPSPHQCVFGPACISRPGGKVPGKVLCGYCKNIDYHTLYRLADRDPESSKTIRPAVDAYFKELDERSTESVGARKDPVCAIKDPKHRHEPWRVGFNPDDDGPCGPVKYREQLCERCYESATQQQCAWLRNYFDGDRCEFPCVFEDPQFSRLKDYAWRRGPGKDKEWEKDPKRHSECKRRKRRGQLCQPCYNRMNEMTGFAKSNHERQRAGQERAMCHPEVCTTCISRYEMETVSLRLGHAIEAAPWGSS